MSLEEQTFGSPPVEFRSGPLWVWNDAMEQDLLTEQIESMGRAGWGAFFIHPRYGLDVEYLSDEWLRKVRHSVDTAVDAGVDPWLYDEHLWPSGYADGDIPGLGADYRMKALVVREEPGACDDVLAVHDSGDGLRYVCRTALDAEEFTTASGNAYTDLMNPDVVGEFVARTHERYADAVGDRFGDDIPGVFTDEPQIGFPGALPDDVLASVPWTVGLPTLFREEYGYDLVDHLPALFYDESPGGRDYRSVRYDFWRLVTERFVETYTARLADWCADHDLRLTGHYLLEDRIASQIPSTGAVMPHYEHEHVPGIDFLGRFIGGNGTALAAKQASSAARQFDRTAMSELYGCSGQQFPFRVRKWIGDWHLAHGITFLNHHLSLYSMRGERKRDYPPNVFYQQPWWEYNDRIADYFARVVYALRQGDAAADTLLVHPVQTGWLYHNGRGGRADLTGADAAADPVSRLDDRLEALVDDLLSAHVGFDFGDEMILERHGAVGDGPRLAVGDAEYETVVVPHCETLQARTVELLTAFAEAGGDVLVVGDPPELVDGAPDEADALAALLAAARLDSTADDVSTATSRPVRFLADDGSEAAAPVRTHLRRLDDGELVVFAANTSPDEGCEATVRLDGVGRLERWDPETGDQATVATRVDDGATVADVALPPYGSLLLRFDPSAPETAAGASIGRLGRSASPAVELSDADWSMRRHDPNALVLDRCELVLDGQALGETSVERGWVHPHDLDDPAAHVPFEARYSFAVDPAVAGTEMSVVVESGSEVSVAVNGTPLEGDGERWRDPHWRRYDVTDLIEAGDNEVTVAGTRTHTVGVEPVFVLGAFAVEDRDGDHTLRPEGDVETVTDVTGAGYPFYTGELTFETNVDLDAPLEGVLAFEEVHASLARVRVDDGDWSETYWPPWEVPISLDPGTHRLSVRLTTSLRNLTGPHHASEAEPEVVSPFTFRGSDEDGWYEGYRVVPVGFENARLYRTA